MLFQAEVRCELEEVATEKTNAPKKKTMAFYAKPYFKDAAGMVDSAQQLLNTFVSVGLCVLIVELYIECV